MYACDTSASGGRSSEYSLMRSKACSLQSSASVTTTAAMHTLPWTCEAPACQERCALQRRQRRGLTILQSTLRNDTACATWLRPMAMYSSLHQTQSQRTARHRRRQRPAPLSTAQLQVGQQRGQRLHRLRDKEERHGSPLLGGLHLHAVLELQHVGVAQLQHTRQGCSGAQPCGDTGAGRAAHRAQPLDAVACCSQLGVARRGHQFEHGHLSWVVLVRAASGGDHGGLRCRLWRATARTLPVAR